MTGELVRIVNGESERKRGVKKQMRDASDRMSNDH